MSKRWTNAATIVRPTIEVCGRRLLPFCLRHRVALEAIGSPVVFTDSPMTPVHLVAAVRILSSYDLEEVRGPNTLRDKFWLARLSYSQDRLFEQVRLLNQYIESQEHWPRFWVKEEGGSGKSGIPWQLAVVASLVRNGCTLEEAWTMPESEAVWLHIAHTTAAGAEISIITDAEAEAMEKFKAEQLASAKQPDIKRN